MKNFLTGLPAPKPGGKNSGGVYIDLLVDGNFKLVFTKEANKPVLTALLNELMPGLGIRDIDLKQQERRPRRKELKTSIFDAYCTTQDGRRIVIEVQYNSRKDYLDRMLYYSTWPISEQKDVSKKNYRLDEVYILSFCNFALIHDRDWNGGDERKIVSSYSIREDGNGERMTDALHFIFLELERFTKTEAELEDARDELLWYLKNAGKVDNIPFSSRHRVVNELNRILKVESLPPDERTKYDANMKNEFDIRSEKLMLEEDAFERGRVEGVAEGEARGHAAGVAEGRLEIARNFLKQGLSLESIAAGTGLDIEQVRKLAAI